MLQYSQIVWTSRWHVLPRAVQLSSAAWAFSEMNGGGLCGAREVLILRPMRGLLPLQLDCLIKWHHPSRPLTPPSCCHTGLSWHCSEYVWLVAQLYCYSAFQCNELYNTWLYNKESWTFSSSPFVIIIWITCGAVPCDANLTFLSFVHVIMFLLTTYLHLYIVLIVFFS